MFNQLNVKSQASAHNSQRLLESIVRQLVYHFNRNRSTAIPINILANMMRSTLFVLQHQPKIIEQQTDEEIEMIFKSGQAIIEQQLIKLNTMYRSLIIPDLFFDNIKYRDVIEHQIPGFFIRYDFEYHAHDFIYDFDYPLLDGMPLEHQMYHLQGIDLVTEYLQRLAYEQDFIRLFSRNDLQEFLRDYEQQQNISLKFLGVNLCEICLQQFLFALVTKQKKLSISREEVSFIIKQLDSINDSLLSTQRLFCQLAEQVSTELHQYLLKYQSTFRIRLQYALQEHHLTNLIIMHNEQPETTKQLVYHPLLTNEQFMYIIKQFECCENNEKKHAYLVSLKLHPNDLFDLLNELNIDHEILSAYFAALDPIAVSCLLLTCFPEAFAFTAVNNFDNLITAIDQPEYAWQTIFINYCQALGTEQKKLIAEQIVSFRPLF